jgi:hypothetical protein
MKKLSTQKCYSIKLQEHEEEKSGILLEIGKEWLLFANNPVDYVLDGYLLIPRKHLDVCLRGEKEKFTEKVILNKEGGKVKSAISLNLNSTPKLLKGILKQRKVTSYAFNDSSVLYIGKIQKYDGIIAQVKRLTPKARWMKSEKIDFETVYKIELETNYIQSLVEYSHYLHESS